MHDPLTQAERNILRHWSMYGSDGYPIQKVSGNRWIWNEWYGVKGAPVVYKTKRDVTAAIEVYISFLINKDGLYKKEQATLCVHNNMVETASATHAWQCVVDCNYMY